MDQIPLHLRFHRLRHVYNNVLMLAEKAADIIRGKKPLEPQYVDYYKHGVSDENL
jgi:choline dehydrogenase